MERKERTYLRQHRKCKDPRFGVLETTNNKIYKEYCTWFALYTWYDKNNKNNSFSDKELDLIKNYENASDFANNYLILNEYGKFEYLIDDKTYNLPKINFDEIYTLSKLSKLMNLHIGTVESYCKYLNLYIYHNEKDYKCLKGEDLRLFYEWCNKYDKKDRANLISQKTIFEKYGVNHSLQSLETQNKMRNTCKYHYGVEHPSQNKEILKRMENTNLISYGVRNASQSQKIKDKKSETTKEHYGVENPFQSEELILKLKKTKLEKYGKLYNPSIKGRYIFDELKFDSLPELYFYYYNKNILNNNIEREIKLPYFDKDDIKHIYICDFRINNQLIEIKGKHLIDDNGELISCYKNANLELLPYKSQCMRDNNVKIILSDSDEMKEIIKIVDEKFPNLVESCKITNQSENSSNNIFNLQ